MNTHSSSRRSSSLLAGTLAVRAILLSALWWILTEGSVSGWALGAPVIAIAIWTSLALDPPGTARWRLTAAPGFAAFFIRESVIGGLDVARRAFDPRLPVEPDFLDVQLRLPAAQARVFFSNCVSLLPGTVSVDLGSGSLRIHLLDRNMPVETTLRTLEEHVARLFDLELARHGEPRRD